MYKLTFYVPDTHLNTVKSAIFAAGAGRIGDYDACCWQVLGHGQFRPLDGASPFLGQVGVIEMVDEWRVEAVVEAAFIHGVLHALKTSHPYETPAYDVVKVEAF